MAALPRRARTTNSRHGYPIAPNTLACNFEAAAPNQVWLADLTLEFADTVLHLADLPVAGHVIVTGNRNAPAFQHQSAPAVQKVGRNPVAPGNNRNAVTAIERLLDNPELFSGTPVTTTTAVGDDL